MIVKQIGQRNKLVFAVIVIRPWKRFRLPKRHLPLVRQSQKALNDISTRHSVGLYWVPGHAGVQGKEIADKLARDGCVKRFVGPEPLLGVSRQNIRRKMKHWVEKQYLVLWRGPCSTHRGRLENWSLALIWLQGPDYCPFLGHNPGLLLACLLDITPWEDIFWQLHCLSW